MQNSLLFMGLTGGAGAGKSVVLEILRKEYGAFIIESDEVARRLSEPGGECYESLRRTFPDETLWNADGSMNRERFGKLVFSNEEERNRLNRVVHPAVKRYIINEFEKEKKAGRKGLLIVEAALLIEENYDEICDELWYVYASEETRRKRLKETRGYSDEKIDDIFASQLPEKTFRHCCSAWIDNDGDLSKTREEIRRLVEAAEA